MTLREQRASEKAGAEASAMFEHVFDQEGAELVAAGDGCPNCGTRVMDNLICQDDGIRCTVCRTLYHLEA